MPAELFALGPLLDGLSEAVLALENGRVTGLNRACAELLQVSPERALGRQAIEVLRQHRLEAVALRGGEVEVELRGRLVRAWAVPGGLVMADITEERRRSSELREVMAVLSHELRTPVAAVKGLLEALSCEPPPEQAGRFLVMALAEAERLARLVEDLTVGFRPQVERSFAVGEAVQRVLALLADELAARGVRVWVHGEEILVRCDPDKLVQVLLNLVQNAAHHGPIPGVVRLRAALAGGQVSVSLLDGGGPLPDYDSLFEAHRRGDGALGPGTGMGLYIVRSIVSGWSGTVWARHRQADDTAPAGNEFGFTVPAA